MLAVISHQTSAFYIDPETNGMESRPYSTDNAAEETIETRGSNPQQYGITFFSQPQSGNLWYRQPPYGNTMNGPTQYGITIYGPTQNGNEMFSPPQYGSQIQYGQPQYANAIYSPPQYGSQMYGQSQYGNNAMYGQPPNNSPATVQTVNGTCNRIDCLKLHDSNDSIL